MNIIRTKVCLLALAIILVAGHVSAQKKSRTPRARPTGGYGNSTGYGNTGYGAAAAKDTTKKKTQAQAATAAPSGYGGTSGGGYGSPSSGYGGAGGSQAAAAPVTGQPINQSLPITTIKSSGSGIGDTVPPSLRNDNVVDRQLVRERVPLTYENIREDDAVYKQRVWREIDTREKINLPFRYAAKEDNGDQHFISILFSAIQSGEITAFSGDDDRFTTPMTKDEVSKMITGGMDTVPSYDMNGEIIGYQARQRMIEPDSVYRFRLKEEWVFDKESSRMFVRILGIAPIMNQYSSNGILVAPDRVLFWVYYPDLRPTLGRYEVYNGKNYGARMTWEELFESRFFSSYITKSTVDNPFDQSMKQYIKDPLNRLYEGENIKDKIFNYEQDLWSY